MVLSQKEIRKRINKSHLIEPFEEKNIQTCSYDLTFSGEYYYYQPGRRGCSFQVDETTKNALCVPANAICYVVTNEKINMPNDLTASISLSFGLIKKGVILSNQPPFDAGYKGIVVALLHNLSNQEVCIGKGDHILNIVFEMLSSPVEAGRLYAAQYQNMASLEDYFKVKKYDFFEVRGAVFDLAGRMDRQTKKFNNALPSILTASSITVAALTIIITINTGIVTGSSLFENIKNVFSNTTSSTESDIKVSDDEKTILITINGKEYSINVSNPEGDKSK